MSKLDEDADINVFLSPNDIIEALTQHLAGSEIKAKASPDCFNVTSKWFDFDCRHDPVELSYYEVERLISSLDDITDTLRHHLLDLENEAKVSR